jgi:uncharacterized protein with HEPN domain
MDEDRRASGLIAHEYFRIDLDVIETIVEEQLGELDAAAERVLEEDDAAAPPP